MRKNYSYIHSHDADIHRYDPSPCLVEAGTPLPEHTCGDCQFYLRGRLTQNCAHVSGGCTGPLRPACKKFQPKNNLNHTTMEDRTTPTTKVCKTCGRELPVEAFGKHARTADGLQPVCRECQRTARKGVPLGPRKRRTDDPVMTEVGPVRIVVTEPEAVANPSVAEIPDQDLVKELRRRGYDVTAKKTIEL